MFSLLRGPRHVLAASMPKAAGTFFLRTIAETTRLSRANLLPAHGHREMELSEFRAAANSFRNYITGAHVCYSKATGRLLRRYGIRPIMIYRNLFDCARSMRDHIRNESHVMPMAFLESYHAAMNDDELDMLIADLIMPWYIRFYVSWMSYEREILLLSYEQITQDTRTTLERVAKFAGIDIDLTKPVLTQNVRFNVGVSGRGMTLAPAAQDRIRGYRNYYPRHDLGPIGL